MKYEVKVGAIVAVFRSRKIIVHAEDAESAKEKAEDRFREIGLQSGWEVGSVEIDYVERMDAQ